MVYLLVRNSQKLSLLKLTKMHEYAELTQRHKHQLRWKKEGGPHCYLGSSCAQSLVRDNRSNRVEALVCSLA